MKSVARSLHKSGKNSATRPVTRSLRWHAMQPPLAAVHDRELGDLAAEKSALPSDPLPLMPASGWPMPALYPFSFKDVLALFGQVGLALAAVFTFGRKRPLAAQNPALGTTLHFRLLHVASFLVILPVIAATRLLPSHWRERHDQSVFVETNHAVLTALGFAFMA